MNKDASKIELFSKLIPLLTAVIAVVGIIIPIAGFSFEQGYLSIFGISSESLPRDLNESWGQSFYIFLIALIFLYKNYLALCLWLLGVISFVAAVVIFIISFFEKEKLRNFFDKWEGISEQDGVVGNSIYVIKNMYIDLKWLFNSLYFSFCVLLVALVLSIFPFNHGREVAQQHLDEFNTKKCEKEIWSQCVQIQDINSNIILQEGFLVAATSNHIALYDGSKTKVIPRLNSYSLVRHKSAVIDKD
jgi:hypothetical protein